MRRDYITKVIHTENVSMFGSILRCGNVVYSYYDKRIILRRVLETFNIEMIYEMLKHRQFDIVVNDRGVATSLISVVLVIVSRDFCEEMYSAIIKLLCRHGSVIGICYALYEVTKIDVNKRIMFSIIEHYKNLNRVEKLYDILNTN